MLFLLQGDPRILGCDCALTDLDGDGANENLDVTCAKARLELDFRLLIGTEYLITWNPFGAPGIMPEVGIEPTRGLGPTGF